MTAITINAQNLENTNTRWVAGRPDGHAPISVMGDHMHGKGEWMFSYRSMFMNMGNLKSGNEDVSFDNALTTYMVTPTKMPMYMHMLNAMYAISDNMTLAAMTNVTTMTMDHITRSGGSFTTEVSGIGDVSLTVLARLFNKNSTTMHANLGVSLPTGSITKKDVTPASAPNATVLPYPMQLGSGTVDAHIGLTYLYQTNFLSYGAQLKSVFRFGENKRTYRYGNRFSFNNWIAAKASDWLSLSLRLEGIKVEELNGLDPNLNPMMVVTADTMNSGGDYINAGFGFNVYIPNGSLKNLRVGLEVATPLYQDLNGIQLKNKEQITLGIQYSLR